MIRHIVAGLIASAALALDPPSAIGQEEVFFQRLPELTAALEGTYGDEGASIGEALDQMSSALASWDRTIQGFETRIASESPTTPARSAVDLRVSLAWMYARRGRLENALRAVDAAILLEPKRADAFVLRGLVLDASGRSSEAGGAFLTAWLLDRGDPIKAYYVFRHAATTGTTDDVQAARESLAATYGRLKEETRAKSSPFAEIGIVQDKTNDALLLPFAAYAHAYTRISDREYDTAIAEFRRAAAMDSLVADPAARSASMSQAVSALRQGRLADARSLLENSAALRESSEAHRVLGLIYWANSEDDKSVEQLTLAILRKPRDERLRLALFHVLRSTGRDAEAEGALQDTIRVLPDSTRARWWLGWNHERFNRFDDARREFERAAAGAAAGRGPLYAAIGRLAARAADLPAAADAFARAVGATPNDPVAHRNSANVFQQQDRPDDAFVEWVAALLINPLDADAHAGIGQILLNTGRDSDAVSALRRAVELSPDHTEARYALATALMRSGKTQEAAREFERVEHEQRRALADRRLNMSLDVLKEEAALRTAEGDYDRAVALWRQVVDRDPGADPVAYRQLAALYVKLGHFEDAARARAMYEKALRDGRTDRGAPR